MSDASTGLRLKLVTVPKRNAQTYGSEFEQAADIFLSHLFPNDLPQIAVDIRARKQFSVEIRGVSIIFFGEQLVPGAFNLMVEGRC